VSLPVAAIICMVARGLGLAFVLGLALRLGTGLVWRAR
jgi:hypothetical protein